jgi:hypothetical protein
MGSSDPLGSGLPDCRSRHHRSACNHHTAGWSGLSQCKVVKAALPVAAGVGARKLLHFMFMVSLAGAKSPLHRDVDCDSDPGIPAVIKVIAVVDVVDVNVVVIVPILPPGRRPRVNRTQPIALVLEARISPNHQEGETGYAETMTRPKVSVEAIVRNAVAAVTTALLPGAMI